MLTRGDEEALVKGIARTLSEVMNESERHRIVWAYFNIKNETFPTKTSNANLNKGK